MAIRVAVNGYGTIGKRVADAVALQKGIKIAGTIQDLMGKVDVIVDGAPKKIGKENLEKFYKPNRIKATFQGGEKHATAGTSFVAQCNYDEAVGKDYVRVVSCNTTGLVRTLNEINRLYGIDSVHATMIRRGADPPDIYHGPIKLFYMQAVHQESDVVPENVDAIRAMMGEKDAQKSIRMTNEAMGIK